MFVPSSLSIVQEFVLNLSTLSRGSLDEKLKWTFQLYDVNGDGFISREEMTEVMTSVYELMGKVPEGCKEENQIKEKVENVFKVLIILIYYLFSSYSAPLMSFFHISLYSTAAHRKWI